MGKQHSRKTREYSVDSECTTPGEVVSVSKQSTGSKRGNEMTRRMQILVLVLLLPLLLAAKCYNPPKITIVNDLEHWNIEYIYISHCSEDSWGMNSLRGSSVLLPGESLEIVVVADTYDMQVVDSDGDTYTIWEQAVGEEGFTWEVVLSDLD